MNIERFGVFRLGQIWSVVQPDGRAVGFEDRRVAVRTAHALAAAAMKRGRQASVIIQDELGKLTTVAPLELVSTTTPPADPPTRPEGARPPRVMA